MVRKTVFTKEDVIHAALAVLDKDGVENLSARRVAEEMGASTAPVYSNFAKMDDLVVAVKKVAVDRLKELTTFQHTPNPFLNIGVGVLEFARLHPLLYNALFLQANDECEAGPGFFSEMLENMSGHPDLAGIKLEERALLLRKMAVFTHGLATFVCAGLPPEIQWEELLALMEDVGGALTADAVARSPRSSKDLSRFGTLCQIPLNSAKDEK